MWALLLGALLPPVVAFVQQPGWSERARAVVAVLVCGIAGFVTVYIQGNVHSGRQLTTTILLVMVAALTTYRNFWKPTRIAPVLEHATSPH